MNFLWQMQVTDVFLDIAWVDLNSGDATFAGLWLDNYILDNKIREGMFRLISFSEGRLKIINYQIKQEISYKTVRVEC